MRWGLVVAMLCACGGKGAVLEIHTKAHRVEVWIADDECSIDLNGTTKNCPHSIAWATMGPRTPVDQNFALLEGFPLTLTPNDGVINLGLQAPAGHNSLERILIIGYDAMGAPIEAQRIDNNITIPADHEVWRVDLQPAEDVTAFPDPATMPRNGITQRAHAWPVDTPHQCVVWQEFDGSSWTREVIAPNDDHDCDGFADGDNVECNDFWFRMSSTTAGGVCTQSTAGPGQACTLGTQAGTCTDGTGGAVTCTQDKNPTTCVPDVVCTGCTNPLDPTCPAMQYDTSATAAPVIGCPLLGESTTGTLMPCTTGLGSTTSIQLPFACLDAALTTRELPPVTVHTNGTTFTDGGVMLSLHVAPGTSTCQIDLAWESGTPTANLLKYTLHVNLGLDTIVLPVVYQFGTVTLCDQAATCSMNLDMGSGGSGSGDHIWDCLR